MGIFSFKKKTSVEDELRSLFSAKEFDRVISIFVAARDKNQEISISAKRIAAHSYQAKKEYQNALILYEEIILKEEDLHNQFNFLMALTCCGKVNQGKELFDIWLTKHLPINLKNPHELTLPYMRYKYAGVLIDAQLFDKALEQLEEIKNLHMTAYPDEDIYKLIKSFPFLFWTLDITSEIYNGLNKDVFSQDIYKYLYANLDDKMQKQFAEHQKFMKRFGLYK